MAADSAAETGRRGLPPVLLQTSTAANRSLPRHALVARPNLPGGRPPALERAVREADAAFRAAANTVTFGKADQYAAAANAFFGMGDPGSMSQRYERNLLAEHARDNADAHLRPTGHGIGELAGVALLARLGGRAGLLASGSFPANVKGALGEALSMDKTIGNGDFPRSVQVRRPLATRWTDLDHTTFGGQDVEAKFGPSADLTAAQRRAAKELARYRVDWWLPRDVGKLTGSAASTTGAIGAVRADQQGR